MKKSVKGKDGTFTMYGYQDVATGEVFHIYNSPAVVKICSPDGFEADLAKGKCKIVELEVIVVGEAN